MLQLMEERVNVVCQGDIQMQRKDGKVRLMIQGEIILIQPPGDAKIGHRRVMNTHSHSEVAPNI
jgi:hypothetical protein